MKLQVEDLTMQDLKGVVADAKSEGARDGHWAGLKLGLLVASILSAALILLSFNAGIVRLAPATTGAPNGVTVIPPPVERGIVPPLPGLPPPLPSDTTVTPPKVDGTGALPQVETAVTPPKVEK